MMKKNTLALLLLLAAGWTLLPVQRAAAQTLRLPPRATAPAPAPVPEFTTGRRVGAALLNPILGLGSWTMGDAAGGLIVTALEGAAVGCLFWELSLTPEDSLYLKPGTAALITGGAAVLFGFIRPFFYHRTPSTQTAARSSRSAFFEGLDITLVNAAGTPRAGLKTAPGVRLSYSFKF